MKFSRFNNKTLILIFALSFAFYLMFASRSLESPATSPSIFDSTPATDFTITTSPPSIVPADGTTPATSIIIVNPIGDLTGSVILSDAPLPEGIKCRPILPTAIPNGLGMATLSCSSATVGTYSVNITGVSGGISHSTTRAFTFSSFTPPDFTITAVSPVGFSLGNAATSNVTVAPQGEFDSQVNLTTSVYPKTGLSVYLAPPSLALGSGLSTATFNASSPGDYSVMIIGTSGSLSHATTIVVAVTMTEVAGFQISSSGSININLGTLGTTKITITSSNGFTGTVTLSIVAPNGVSCTLSPTGIRSSGESTLTCSSNIAGDYAVLIRASSGENNHTMMVNVHVASLSPVAPTPSTSPKDSTWIFYIVTVMTVIIIASTELLSYSESRSALRSRITNIKPLML